MVDYQGRKFNHRFSGILTRIHTVFRTAANRDGATTVRECFRLQTHGTADQIAYLNARPPTSDCLSGRLDAPPYANLTERPATNSGVKLKYHGCKIFYSSANSYKGTTYARMRRNPAYFDRLSHLLARLLRYSYTTIRLEADGMDA